MKYSMQPGEATTDTVAAYTLSVAASVETPALGFNLDLSPAVRDTFGDESDLSPSFQRAAALYRQAAYGEAFDVLNAEAAGVDACPRVLSLMGLCRLRLGDIAASLEMLARAAGLAPRDGEILLAFGMGLMASGDATNAAKMFRLAAEKLPLDPAPSLNLAAALLTLGDIAGARREARKARLRAPELPAVHYTVGLVEAAGGDLEAAARAFSRAVQRSPGFAEAWLNLGVTRYRLSNVAGARAAFDQALRVRPGFAAAQTNLAALDRIEGLSERAARRIDAVLAADPTNQDALVNRAASLLADEKPQEALAILEGPPPTDALAATHWRLQKISALLDLRRNQEARAIITTLDHAPAVLAPLVMFRRALLADMDGERDQARRHIETMEAQLRATPGILPEHRLIGWYDAGRFWSYIGEAERGFAARVEGHRLLAALQPFSRADYAAFHKATIEAFNKDRLHNGPRANDHDPAPVFIVGMPRSGTTLLEQILSAHPAVHGAGERMELGGTYRQLGGAIENPASAERVARLGTEVLDQAAKAYLRELHALAPSKSLIVDKMPSNFQLLGLASLLLPGARVIACERDARDIGLSIFSLRFYGYHPYAHDLGDLGWYIARQRELMAHWRAASPLPILTVELSDWVRDFPSTLRRVLDFLQLPYDPACERYYDYDRKVETLSRHQVRQPINTGGIGRWRRFASQLSPLIAELEAAGVELTP